jgi:hypothetical protein
LAATLPGEKGVYSTGTTSSLNTVLTDQSVGDNGGQEIKQMLN